MHISEGVLAGPVLLTAAAAAAGGTAIGLKQLDYDQIAHAGLLSAGFFVASLIHVPLGPSNAHLILNGVVGLLLGWAAFPVILVALLLQSVFFQFGGVTTLGVNTCIMAVPAVLCHYLFKGFLWKNRFFVIASAFACGFLSVLLGGVITAAALIFSKEHFIEIAVLIVGVHLPVMIIEGVSTAFFILFLKKVQPEMLPGYIVEKDRNRHGEGETR